MEQAQPRLAFPQGFRWGVATSSYQCEGGATNAQWHAWEASGHIHTGDVCGLACDWWHAAERDFDLAADLGLNALRLSLEWSRIEPRPGVFESAALDRYRAMLRALRERGIEPMVTLHHFTHPIWFEERGAFLAEDSVPLFERYVEHVVGALGDLCDLWCTLNEPNVYSTFGYLLGVFPPGRLGDMPATVRVQAAMARAHAAAYAAIHRLQPTARVGWAHHYNIFDPERPASPLDRLAADLQDAAFNDFFPRAVRTGTATPALRPLAGDLRAVRGTCDFVGINVYARDLVRFSLRRPTELFGKRLVAPGAPRGDGTIFSEIYPPAIGRVAARVAGMGKPIYVTENGLPDAEDRLRPWALACAARELHTALAQGLDLRGYYHWSLVDNFEWAEGWSLRFGLYALDPETQQRTPRPSAGLYGSLARANAIPPELLRLATAPPKR